MTYYLSLLSQCVKKIFLNSLILNIQEEFDMPRRLLTHVNLFFYNLYS